MSIVRIDGIPKMGSAGDTAPAPFLTISMVPEIMPAKPPSVSSKRQAKICSAPMAVVQFDRRFGSAGWAEHDS